MSFLIGNGDEHQYAKLYDQYEANKAAWEEKYNIKERRHVKYGLILSWKEMSEEPFPPSRVVVDKKTGYIDLYGYGKYNPYPIEISRIKTKTSLLHWIMHISEKDWFENDMLHDFIEAVFWVNRWGDAHGWV